MSGLPNSKSAQHPISGRWYQSQLELAVHNYLVETQTPYYSGVDPQVLFPPNHMRSDDIVIPERPTLDLPEVRIEVAGMWRNKSFGEEKMLKYQKDKTEVHNYWVNRNVVHIILKPSGRSNMPRKYLEQQLGKYVGGSQALIDALDPPRRPAATYNAGKEMLDTIRTVFTKGSQISSDLILEKLGPGFYLRLTKFYPNQTLHTVAELCELTTMNAPYGETEDQFISRLRKLMDERYGGSLPSSEKLRQEESWVNERATHFFGSYRKLRTHLGLKQLPPTNSIPESRIRAELIQLIPKGERMPSSHVIQKKHQRLYKWLRYRYVKKGFSSPMDYCRWLVSDKWTEEE